METPRNWRYPDGTPMTCLDGCDKPVEVAGRCLQHYHRSRRKPNPVRLHPKPRGRRVNRDGSPLPCESRDCDRPILARGLCALHYDREWKGAYLDNNDWTSCPVPGCGRNKTDGSLICGRCRQTRWRYGLTDESYLSMMQPENRFCANPGCRDTEKLHLDHDHSCCPYGKFPTKTRVSCGECVRGWLCRSCNTSLGQMQESPERIRGLLTYLERVTR